MKAIKRTILPLLCALAMLFTGTLCCAAPAEEPKESISVESHSIVKENSTGIVYAGDKLDITLVILDESRKHGEYKLGDNLTIAHSGGGFTGGSISDFQVISTEGFSLKYRVTFSKVKWSGLDINFGMSISYKNEYKSHNVLYPISECTIVPPTEITTPDFELSEPFFRITTQQPAGAIKAGDEGELDVFIRNMSNTVAERVVVEISGSDEVIVVGESQSQQLDEIKARDMATISFKYRALSTITQARQVFTIKLTYVYFGSGGESVSVYDKQFTFQAEISTTEHTYPVLNAKLDIAESSISPNKEYTGVLEITNRGSSGMKDIFAEVTSTDGLVIMSNTASRYYQSMEKSDTVKLAFKFRTMNTLTSPVENVTVKLNYNYEDGTKLTEGSYERTFTLFNGATAADPEKSAPVALITLDGGDKAVTAGGSYKYKVEILNKGGINMENVRLTLTSSDALTITGGTGSAFFDKISAGKSVAHTVAFLTAAEIPASRQSFTAELSYSYVNADGSRTEGSATQPLTVVAEVSGAPRIRMTGSKLNTVLAPNSTYSYTLTFTNLGAVPVREFFASLIPTDGIILDNNEAYIDLIEAGKSASVVLTIKTDKSFSSVKQGISAQMNYCYGAENSASFGESSGSVVLVASSENVSSSEGGSTNAAPNIIIGNYDIGAEQIAAGETFNMNFDFFNTSSAITVENLIMTISAGGEINISGSGNTFYYPTLAAGGSVSESISLKALATATTGISSVSVSFKYDYLDNGNRVTATSEQTIFIPVYQPDKMTFDVKTPTYEVYAGNEVYITLSWLNKGRSDISNIKAEIVGDVAALTTEKIIGTVVPGGNGTADFIINPYMGGECSFNIKITYEDATLTEITREIPVSFTVMEMDYPMFDDPGMGGFGTAEPMPEEGEGGFPWWIVFVGGGVVIVAAVIIIIVCVRRSKKKKAAQTEPDWEDDFDNIRS